MSNRVTSNRRAFEIIAGMIHGIILDAATHLGERPGLGDCKDGEARVTNGSDDDQYPFGRVVPDSTPDERLTWSAQGYFFKTLPLTDLPSLPSAFDAAPSAPETALNIEPSGDTDFGRAGLIKVEDAAKIAEDVARRYVARVKILAEKRLARGVNAYHHFSIYNRVKFSAADRLIDSKIKLLRSAYPGKRGKKGVQRISTRRTKGVPKRGWFQFNGRPAFHGTRGRRPLTAAQWIEREHARRAKRNKGKTARLAGIVAPPLGSGLPRPDRPLTSIGKHDTVQPRNVYLGNASPDLDPLEFYTASDLDPVMVAGTFPDMSGQV